MPLIFALSLAIAISRNTRSPALFPLRAAAVIYTDVFRGVPVILTIFLIGFGVPGLFESRTWSNPLIWGTVALVLSYSAYVSEEIRAGIEGVHESQRAAARSLGMTSGQTMTSVVLPQAMRRIVPPMMNSLVSLQKDVALDQPHRADRDPPPGRTRQVQVRQLHALRRGGRDLPLCHDPLYPTRRLSARPRTAPDRRHDRDMKRPDVDPEAAAARCAQVVRRERRARRHRPRRRRRRGDHADRRLRLGQVHAAALHQPARADRRRRDPARRRRHRRTRARPRSDPPADRDDLPELQPVPAHERRRQRRDRAAQGARRREGRGRPHSRAHVRLGLDDRASTHTRTSSRAASSSASRSPDRWRCTPR